MRNIVVDTSVVIKWLHRKDEFFLDQADYLLQRGVSNDVSLMVPELVKYEVGNVLSVAKRLPLKQLIKALDLFYSLPLLFFPENLYLSRRAGRIAQRLGITHYDSAFLALSEKNRAALVTANPKHQRPIPGWKVKVIPLKDYK